jgi:lipopolysaccharide transport system permease protein
MNDFSLPATITRDSTLAKAESPRDSEEGRKYDFDIWLEAGRTEKHYWLDLWRYRELFVILAWRDVAVRYKQTIVGVAWSLLQPFLTMIVMTIVFGKLASLHSEGTAPYAIMVFSGMLPWQFFANSLATSGQSLVSNAGLVSKVYFPRLIVPASAVGVSLADFAISFLILGAMMLFYRFIPSWHILTLPVLVFLSMVIALGPGLFVTALNVKYRDFRFVLPFMIQFGLYICPVGFSSSIIKEKCGEAIFLLYSLNPMVGVIDGYRWAIIGDDAFFSLPSFLISMAVGLALLMVGIWYFRKTERTFADII